MINSLIPWDSGGYYRLVYLYPVMPIPEATYDLQHAHLIVIDRIDQAPQ